MVISNTQLSCLDILIPELHIKHLVLGRIIHLFSLHNSDTWHYKRKKTSVTMHNEVNKTMQFGRLQCYYYWWDQFIKYATEMVWGDIIHISCFIHVRLQHCCYWWDWFKQYAIKMASDGMAYISRMMISSGIQVIIASLPHSGEFWEDVR
jgi:hypothetical protein